MHRVFSPRQLSASGLADNLAGMSHAIVLQIELARGIGAEYPEAVMGIGEFQTGAMPGEPGGEPEHQNLEQPWVGAVIEKTRPKYHAEPVLLRQLHHGAGILKLVLAIGIERNNPLRPAPQRILNAGLECGALPQIGRVPHYRSTSRLGLGYRIVARAIIYADYSITGIQDFAYDVANYCLLVINGDDKPNWGGYFFIQACTQSTCMVAGNFAGVAPLPLKATGLAIRYSSQSDEYMLKNMR